MKNFVFKSFAAIILCLQFNSVNAQILWSDLRAGMTAREIMAARPDAKMPREPHIIKATQEKLEFELSQVSILNKEFTPGLFMKDGRLTSVLLSGDFLGSKNTMKSFSESVRDLLVSKYGREIKYDVDFGEFVNIVNASWGAGKNLISFTGVSVGQDKFHFSIMYKTVNEDQKNI